MGFLSWSQRQPWPDNQLAAMDAVPRDSRIVERTGAGHAFTAVPESLLNVLILQADLTNLGLRLGVSETVVYGTVGDAISGSHRAGDVAHARASARRSRRPNADHDNSTVRFRKADIDKSTEMSALTNAARATSRSPRNHTSHPHPGA